MFGRLIEAYRWAKAAERSAPARPRWRPAVEQLECRLAPSLTPLHAAADGLIAQPAQSAPIHIANQMLATAAAPASAQDQAVIAILQAAPAKTERDAGFVASVAAPPSDTPCSEAAPSVPDARAEFFALTAVEAERLITDSSPSREESPPAQQTVPAEAAPAHSSMPLLAWVIGLACLLALHWERRLAAPALSRAVAAWARYRRTLAAWTAFVGQVSRPRAPPANA